MKPTDFSPGRRSSLRKIGEGDASYLACVPTPLPPQLEWGQSTVQLLSAADRALGRLAGVGQTLLNPHLLIGPFTRREAVLSSRIEGTQASLSDLLLFEANPDADQAAPDVQEVANYVRAMEHGLERRKTLPMSLRLIREMHKKLMRGVRGHERTPGEFRTSQNWIGPPGCLLAQATYVPAPPEALMDVLSEFERFLHAPSDLPPLVRLSLIHYQFEAIHPFLDGNGRIGRLLISILLCIEGVLPLPLLYLSAFFERNRDEYYQGLRRVTEQAAWTEWIEFFLRGVAEQATDALSRAEKLVAMRERYRTKVQTPRSSALLQALIDQLFARPSITTAGAAESLGITVAAAQRNIDRLVRVGVLREATGRRRGRIWVAHEIRRALE